MVLIAILATAERSFGPGTPTPMRASPEHLVGKETVEPSRSWRETRQTYQEIHLPMRTDASLRAPLDARAKHGVIDAAMEGRAAARAPGRGEGPLRCTSLSPPKHAYPEAG